MDGEERLICTTVHKAKGLQYDTVILPYCNLNITNTIDKGNVDIVYDRPRVAYRVTEQQESQKGPKDVAFTNNYYDNIKKDENESRKKEETRILYVAMTRAKRRLVAMITEPKGKSMETWGTLIKEGMQ